MSSLFSPFSCPFGSGINQIQLLPSTLPITQDGVPFEDSRTTGTVGKKGSCVIPLDLETNVVKLHELLFDVTEYEPSDQVKQYSQKVQADTSQYIKK